MEEIYDLAIIGTGPAGLTAAVYGARYMLRNIVIGTSAGGMIAQAHKVCNFPSHETITGFELSQKMAEQVKHLDVPIKLETVSEIKNENDIYQIKTKQAEYFAKKIVFALGTTRRKLGVDGEGKFTGKGVSYCATCDSPFFKDKTVAVIGGSDAALTAALLLTEYATKVYIIYRKDHFFRAEPAWIKLVEQDPKIECIFEANLKEIKGSSMVESVLLDNGNELDLGGVFVEIGSTPNTKLAELLGVELDKGYIKTDKAMKTNVKGVFAAGDVTNNSLKQAITAAGEGATAVKSAYDELTIESSKGE